MVSLFIARRETNERICSVGAVHPRRDIEQVSLLLVIAFQSLLVRYDRAFLEQFLPQLQVLVENLPILQLILYY